MRRAVILLAIARTAAAEPPPDSTCGFGCKFEPEAAVRVGVSDKDGSEVSRNLSTNLGDDPAPDGAGLLLEAEAGVRTGAITLAAFANHAGVPELDSSGSTGHVSCVATDAIEESFVSGGARLRFHFGGGFAGFGVGFEDERKTTTCVASGMAVSISDTHLLYELHVGYTLPKLGPVAFQVLAAITYGAGDYPTSTTRLALGLQF